MRSLRDFEDTRLGWDPGPRHQCHSAELGGPGPPSGPAHQAQVSRPHLGPNHRQPRQLQRRHLPRSCRPLPESGGRCLSGTPFQGTSHFTKGLSSGVLLRCPCIDGRSQIQGFYEADRTLFPAALHDPETVLLPPGGAAVLPFDDILGSSWFARASFFYR